MSDTHRWITRGFEAFRRGTFGNAGQNLNVSRRGVLQRIHLFDLNRAFGSTRRVTEVRVLF